MALAAGVVSLGLGLADARAQGARGGVLVVSRKRLLNETEAARALLEAEIDLTAELQNRVDAIKAQLNAEEEELARLRPTLARDVFDARVKEFDRRVRGQRREMQQRSAALQNAFRVARVKLVDQLGPVLEAVRIDRGASIIVNQDLVMASDPAADVTDEVIGRVNRTVPMPAFPELDLLELAPESPAGAEPAAPAE